MSIQHSLRLGRLALAGALISSLLSCKYSPLPLERLGCSSEHPCADGYVCQEGQCLPANETECTPERLAQPCSAGVGACLRAGPQYCDNGRLACGAQPLAPGIEVCDGLDNDCDGQTDEGSGGAACELTAGVCAGSSRTCGGAAGWGRCDYGPDFEATETRCDGLDNDCDGQTDEVAGCVRLETIAGDGPPGMRDGAAAEARFATLKSMTRDASGNLFVADYQNHAIRMITPDGEVSTLAGDGTCGFQDGPASTARLCFPWDLELGTDGTLYVSDSANHRIRALAGGQLTTIAGGSAGWANGAALGEARFNYPSGIKLLPNGDLLVADRGNHRIRRLDRASGQVVDMAGIGNSGLAEGSRSTVELSGPNDVTVDATGTLYVSETSHRIRAIPLSGSSQTLAGSTTGLSGTAADAAGTAARFNVPLQLDLDPGDAALYVVDSNNFRVRRVPLVSTQTTTSVVGTTQTSTGLKNGTCAIAKFSALTGFARSGPTWFLAESGGLVRRVVSTGSITSPDCLVGDFAGGTADDKARDGAALTARLRRPLGLARANDGTLYWVEREDGKLRKLSGGMVTTIGGAAGGGFEDGALATAKFDNLRDIAIAPDGLLFTVESQNHVVRRIDPANGQASTLAGIKPPVAAGALKSGYVDSSSDAHAVRFNQPRAIAYAVVGGTAFLYVSDAYNCVVRRVEVATGFTSTYGGIADTGPNCPAFVDGAAGTARLQSPAALVASSTGTVYVADLVSGGTRVRLIAPDGAISTLHVLPFEVNGLKLEGTTLLAVGDGRLYTLSTVAPYPRNEVFSANPGWRDGPPESAGALELTGLAADTNYYYLTDEMTHRVRRVRR